MPQNKFKTQWIKYRFSYQDKNLKATINPINRDDVKCFQYAKTLALSHKET